jgi:hypothetical protein
MRRQLVRNTYRFVVATHSPLVAASVRDSKLKPFAERALK